MWWEESINVWIAKDMIVMYLRHCAAFTRRNRKPWKTTAENKNARNYTSTPHYAFMEWCSVKAQGQLYFTPRRCAPHFGNHISKVFFDNCWIIRSTAILHWTLSIWYLVSFQKLALLLPSGDCHYVGHCESNVQHNIGTAVPSWHKSLI
jgi:hypothetical protein